MLLDLSQMEGFLDFQDESPKSWMSLYYAGVDNLPVPTCKCDNSMAHGLVMTPIRGPNMFPSHFPRLAQKAIRVEDEKETFPVRGCRRNTGKAILNAHFPE